MQETCKFVTRAEAGKALASLGMEERNITYPLSVEKIEWQYAKPGGPFRDSEISRLFLGCPKCLISSHKKSQPK